MPYTVEESKLLARLFRYVARLGMLCAMGLVGVFIWWLGHARAR